MMAENDDLQLGLQLADPPYRSIDSPLNLLSLVAVVGLDQEPHVLFYEPDYRHSQQSD